MAKAYQYDASGYFAGEVEDYGGPLPNNATRTVPQEQDGFVPCWTGTAWEQVENHKGEEGYVDGIPYTIKDYGPLPEGWNVEPPVRVLTLEEAKAEAVQKVKDAGYAAEIKGLIIQGMAIPTDRDSQSLITGAVVGTLLEPGKVTRWQTATTREGIPVFIELSAEQLQAIGKAVRSYVQSCFDTRDAKFTEIAALKTPEAVAAWLEANLKIGWPK